MKDLIVKHDDNGVFKDLSNEARDYLRDPFSVTFIALEDRLLIGLYKPFNQIFTELNTTDVTTNTLTFKIGTATGFVAIEVDDDTNGYARSGFQIWDRKQDAWIATTEDGVEAFWLEVTSANDFVIDFDAINIVYADDIDLVSEVRNINEYLFENDTSFIAYHVASRNDIVQSLRNGGNFKELNMASPNPNLENITKWDLLDAGEIRQAAKYLALAKIFFDVSENTEDKAYQRFRDYEGMYGAAFKLFRMSIDKDDDGVTDTDERLTLNDVTVTKV